MVVWAPTWFGSAAAGGFAITNCVMLDGSADYLSFTPGSAGNRDAWTLSVWFKLSEVPAGTGQTILSAGATNDEDYLRLDGDGKLQYRVITSSSTVVNKISSAIYRDPTAWGHAVVRYDNSGSTCRLWFNGSEITAFATNTNPSSDSSNLNNNVAINIGRRVAGTDQYADLYVSNIVFADGTMTDADSFGEIDSDTGIWIPKDYSGSYGTNGFKLEFKQTGTSQNSSGIGADTSGEDNHFAVTSLAAANITTDSPTNTAADNEGNYCTLNPLDSGGGTFSNGNLNWTGSASKSVRGTIVLPAGVKARWEVKTKGTGGSHYVGVIKSSDDADAYTFDANEIRYNTDAWGISVDTTGTNGARPQHNNSLETSLFDWAEDDVLGVYWDGENGTLKFNRNGGSLGTAYSSLATTASWIPILSDGVTDGYETNFGSTAFTHSTVDSNYEEGIATQNLPEPTITDPSAHFQIKTWTGNGSDARALTFDGNSDLQPDLIWIKNRDDSADHVLFDSVRGFSTSTTGTQISSNLNADQPSTTGGHVQSVQSDGFTLKDGTAGNADHNVNNSSDDYVAWGWKAGGEPSADNTESAGSSQTAGSVKIDGANGSSANGSIAVTRASANTTAGFSIITYTGTGSNGTVPHFLGVAPEFICVKKRGNGDDSTDRHWGVYHVSQGNTKYALLSDSNAFGTSSGYWNDTTPGTSTFAVGTDDSVNGNNAPYVAYCWTSVEGFSKIGSYTGNNNDDGPFIYLGFKPAFFMAKMSSASGSWFLWDNARATDNPVEHVLFPNESAAENNRATSHTYYQGVDFLANGVKFRNDHPDCNGNGTTNIYAAFAETPFAFNNRAR